MIASWDFSPSHPTAWIPAWKSQGSGCFFPITLGRHVAGVWMRVLGPPPAASGLRGRFEPGKTLVLVELLLVSPPGPPSGPGT